MIFAGGVLALPVSGDISRPQSSSSRSSCEYQQSPVAAAEFVSPPVDYRADRRSGGASGYFRSYNVQQAGGYGYPSPAHYQGYHSTTNGPSSGPAYRQNMQAGGEQGGYSGYGSGYPGYPGYEGAGQEMAGYYQQQHQQQQHQQPHNTNNANYSKSYGHHYPGYYPGASCQGTDNNTPLPPDFTYVGSGGGPGGPSSEASNQTQTGYQDFYAC